jgi:uncharacterized protein (TIGR00645 family)
MLKRIEAIIAAALIASRWLMAPLYLGLIAALLVIVVEFFREIVHLVVGLGGFESSQLIVAVLKLIDLVLVGNLLLIMLYAGILTLGTTNLLDNQSNWSRFMGSVDFAGLKLKVVASVTTIAAVGLLETFVGIEQISTSDVMWDIVILLAFVLSGVLLAWTDLLVARRHERE